MDYLALLENSYEQCKRWEPNSNIGRLEFLAESVFGLTTYENIISSLMAKKFLEVCTAVSDGKTFEYIESEDGNMWFLIMVNMPFFAEKLDWGTSIRGAWWRLYSGDVFKVESCDLYEGEEQLLEISFNLKEWAQFIREMVKFSVVIDKAVI